MDDEYQSDEHSDHEYTEDYILYLEGTEAYYNGEYDKALELLLKSIQLFEHFKTCERLYCVLERLNRNAEALQYIEKGYRLKPKNNKTAVLYAEALVVQNRVDEADIILREVLEQNTTYGPAKALLSRISS